MAIPNTRLRPKLIKPKGTPSFVQKKSKRVIPTPCTSNGHITKTPFLPERFFRHPYRGATEFGRYCAPQSGDANNSSAWTEGGQNSDEERTFASDLSSLLEA
jgi:hypothetical protein